MDIVVLNMEEINSFMTFTI